MDIYNLDQVIDRHNTDATKYSDLNEKYGRDDLMPMWIADMDFAAPATVSEALVNCFRQPVLGYTTPPRSFWTSITDWLANRHGWIIAPENIDYIPGLK